MAILINSRCLKGVSVGRPHVRCAAVPPGQVHFTPPAITAVRAPATENVSYMAYSNVVKPFLVVQAPYDLLSTERDDDSEIRNQDTRKQIADTVAGLQQAANNKFDQPGGQKSTLGMLDALMNAIGASQQK